MSTPFKKARDALGKTSGLLYTSREGNRIVQAREPDLFLMHLDRIGNPSDLGVTMANIGNYRHPEHSGLYRSKYKRGATTALPSEAKINFLTDRPIRADMAKVVSKGKNKGHIQIPITVRAWGEEKDYIALISRTNENRLREARASGNPQEIASVEAEVASEIKKEKQKRMAERADLILAQYRASELLESQLEELLTKVRLGTTPDTKSMLELITKKAELYKDWIDNHRDNYVKARQELDLLNSIKERTGTLPHEKQARLVNLEAVIEKLDGIRMKVDQPDAYLNSLMGKIADEAGIDPLLSDALKHGDLKISSDAGKFYVEGANSTKDADIEGFIDTLADEVVNRSWYEAKGMLDSYKTPRERLLVNDKARHETALFYWARTKQLDDQRDTTFFSKEAIDDAIGQFKTRRQESTELAEDMYYLMNEFNNWAARLDRYNQLYNYWYKEDGGGEQKYKDAVARMKAPEDPTRKKNKEDLDKIYDTYRNLQAEKSSLDNFFLGLQSRNDPVLNALGPMFNPDGSVADSWLKYARKDIQGGFDKAKLRLDKYIEDNYPELQKGITEYKNNLHLANKEYYSREREGGHGKPLGGPLGGKDKGDSPNYIGPIHGEAAKKQSEIYQTTPENRAKDIQANIDKLGEIQYDAQSAVNAELGQNAYREAVASDYVPPMDRIFFTQGEKSREILTATGYSEILSPEGYEFANPKREAFLRDKYANKVIDLTGMDTDEKNRLISTHLTDALGHEIPQQIYGSSTPEVDDPEEFGYYRIQGHDEKGKPLEVESDLPFSSKSPGFALQNLAALKPGETMEVPLPKFVADITTSKLGHQGMDPEKGVLRDKDVRARYVFKRLSKPDPVTGQYKIVILHDPFAPTMFYVAGDVKEYEMGEPNPNIPVPDKDDYFPGSIEYAKWAKEHVNPTYLELQKKYPGVPIYDVTQEAHLANTYGIHAPMDLAKQRHDYEPGVEQSKFDEANKEFLTFRKLMGLEEVPLRQVKDWMDLVDALGKKFPGDFKAPGLWAYSVDDWKKMVGLIKALDAKEFPEYSELIDHMDVRFPNIKPKIPMTEEDDKRRLRRVFKLAGIEDDLDSYITAYLFKHRSLGDRLAETISGINRRLPDHLEIIYDMGTERLNLISQVINELGLGGEDGKIDPNAIEYVQDQIIHRLKPDTPEKRVLLNDIRRSRGMAPLDNIIPEDQKHIEEAPQKVSPEYDELVQNFDQAIQKFKQVFSEAQKESPWTADDFIKDVVKSQRFKPFFNPNDEKLYNDQTSQALRHALYSVSPEFDESNPLALDEKYQYIPPDRPIELNNDIFRDEVNNAKNDLYDKYLKYVRREIGALKLKEKPYLMENVPFEWFVDTVVRKGLINPKSPYYNYNYAIAYNRKNSANKRGPKGSFGRDFLKNTAIRAVIYYNAPHAPVSKEDIIWMRRNRDIFRPERMKNAAKISRMPEKAPSTVKELIKDGERRSLLKAIMSDQPVLSNVDHTMDAKAVKEAVTAEYKKDKRSINMYISEMLEDEPNLTSEEIRKNLFKTKQGSKALSTKDWSSMTLESKAYNAALDDILYEKFQEDAGVWPGMSLEGLLEEVDDLLKVGRAVTKPTTDDSLDIKENIPRTPSYSTPGASYLESEGHKAMQGIGDHMNHLHGISTDPIPMPDFPVEEPKEEDVEEPAAEEPAAEEPKEEQTWEQQSWRPEEDLERYGMIKDYTDLISDVLKEHMSEISSFFPHMTSHEKLNEIYRILNNNNAIEHISDEGYFKTKTGSAVLSAIRNVADHYSNISNYINELTGDLKTRINVWTDGISAILDKGNYADGDNSSDGITRYLIRGLMDYALGSKSRRAILDAGLRKLRYGLYEKNPNAIIPDSPIKSSFDIAMDEIVKKYRPGMYFDPAKRRSKMESPVFGKDINYDEIKWIADPTIFDAASPDVQEALKQKRNDLYGSNILGIDSDEIDKYVSEYDYENSPKIESLSMKDTDSDYSRYGLATPRRYVPSYIDKLKNRPNLRDFKKNLLKNDKGYQNALLKYKRVASFLTEDSDEYPAKFGSLLDFVNMLSKDLGITLSGNPNWKDVANKAYQEKLHSIESQIMDRNADSIRAIAEFDKSLMDEVSAEEIARPTRELRLQHRKDLYDYAAKMMGFEEDPDKRTPNEWKLIRNKYSRHQPPAPLVDMVGENGDIIRDPRADFVPSVAYYDRNLDIGHIYTQDEKPPEEKYSEPIPDSPSWHDSAQTYFNQDTKPDITPRPEKPKATGELAIRKLGPIYAENAKKMGLDELSRKNTRWWDEYDRGLYFQTVRLYNDAMQMLDIDVHNRLPEDYEWSKARRYIESGQYAKDKKTLKESTWYTHYKRPKIDPVDFGEEGSADVAENKKGFAPYDPKQTSLDEVDAEFPAPHKAYEQFARVGARGDLDSYYSKYLPHLIDTAKKLKMPHTTPADWSNSDWNKVFMYILKNKGENKDPEFQELAGKIADMINAKRKNERDLAPKDHFRSHVGTAGAQEIATDQPVKEPTVAEQLKQSPALADPAQTRFDVRTETKEPEEQDIVEPEEETLSHFSDDQTNLDEYIRSKRTPYTKLNDFGLEFEKKPKSKPESEPTEDLVEETMEESPVEDETKQSDMDAFLTLGRDNDNMDEVPEVTEEPVVPDKKEDTEPIKRSSDEPEIMSLRDMFDAIRKSDKKDGHPYGKPIEGNVFAYGSTFSEMGEGKDMVMPKEIPAGKTNGEGATTKKIDI